VVGHAVTLRLSHLNRTRITVSPAYHRGVAIRPNDKWQTRVEEQAAQIVLALNRINDHHRNAGLIGYETGERDELCATSTRR